MKLRLLLTLLVGGLLAQNALAAVCKNANGSPSDIAYDLTTTLTAAQNQAGNIVQRTDSQKANVQAVCPDGSAADGRTFRSYVSSDPVVETDGRWQFLKLDRDRLEGAVAIQDAGAGPIYPPVKYHLMPQDSRVDSGQPFSLRDARLVLNLKIMKPFVGTVNIAPKTMFGVYVTTTSADPLSDVVYNIIYSGSVTVPQSCEINAGQTILVNFGSLYSGNFTHAGEKPAGVRARSFNVPVKCSGVDSTVSLSMRVVATADSSFTQAIASDNPDVGVVVETSDGTALIPNSASSAAPFATDEAGNANIALKAYPVSTTGKVPAEGVFTALASLRVDFD